MTTTHLERVETSHPTPEITSAHWDHFAHLHSEDHAVAPAALAGRYPHGSDTADQQVSWKNRFPVFTHPADPTRLLIGVDTPDSWAVVALDHIAHPDCTDPTCGEVIDQRLRELTEIPADGALFSVVQVETAWAPGVWLPYMVHIDDYRTFERIGWDCYLTEYTVLARSTGDTSTTETWTTRPRTVCNRLASLINRKWVRR